MNERIKSLIERAEYQAGKYPGSDWEVYVEPSREQIFEKFAELIVLEAANEILKWKSEPFPYDPEFGARLIKQHFGVRE
jgi:hypothetical protein